MVSQTAPGENYQAEKFAAEWRNLLEEPNFAGGFIWCFADYDVHRRYDFVHEYRVAYGVFDLRRQPEAVVHAVRQLWTG